MVTMYRKGEGDKRFQYTKAFVGCDEDCPIISRDYVARNDHAFFFDEPGCWFTPTRSFVCAQHNHPLAAGVTP